MDLVQPEVDPYNTPTPKTTLDITQESNLRRRHLGKISNGHISATGRPIHSMFFSRVGFSGTADLMALFPVRKNPRWRPPPS